MNIDKEVQSLQIRIENLEAQRGYKCKLTNYSEPMYEIFLDGNKIAAFISKEDAFSYLFKKRNEALRAKG